MGDGAGCLRDGCGSGSSGGCGGGAPGIESDWPMRMNARASSPLAAMTAATVVPCLAAMRLTVSPATTV